MKTLQRLLFLSFLMISLNTYGQDLEKYLSHHATTLHEGILKEPKVWAAGFDHYQLFLLGEIHGIKEGQDIDFTVVTFLNKYLKLRTYIAEIDFTKADLLNQYLETGNEHFIAMVFEDWIAQDAQWANLDFQQKIRKIRAYNLSLPRKLRIRFEGIDKIQNPVLVAGFLREKLKGQAFNDYNNQFAPLIAALETKNDSLITHHARALNNLLQKNQQFNKLAGKEELFFALKNCMSRATSREQVMCTNFKTLFIMRNWQREKLYAFLGFAHVLQSKANTGKGAFLGHLLANDPDLPLKGKIASIGMLYLDSKMSIPTVAVPEKWQQKGKRFSPVTIYNHDGPLVRYESIDQFKAVTGTHTNTLFDLGAAGSPFLNKVFDISYDPQMSKSQQLLLNEEGKFSTDYFRYLILVRNSEATSPVLP